MSQITGPRAFVVAVGTYVVALLSRWVAWLMSSIAIGVGLNIYERVTGRPIPLTHYLSILVVGFLVASFLAWNHERKGRETAEARLGIPLLAIGYRPMRNYDERAINPHNTVSPVYVRNDGGATAYNVGVRCDVRPSWDILSLDPIPADKREVDLHIYELGDRIDRTLEHAVLRGGTLVARAKSVTGEDWVLEERVPLIIYYTDGARDHERRFDVVYTARKGRSDFTIQFVPASPSAAS